jgi:multiple sugar transport system substrate-binding protein
MSWGDRRATIGAAIAATCLTVGFVTACSADDADSGDQARLTYWAVNMGPTLAENRQLLEQELAAFTKETGVEVDLEVIDWVDLYNRIMTAVSTGRGPDVINVGNTWSASLQDTGALLPFDDEAMEAIGGADKFLGTTLTATGAPDEPPATIPYLGQAYALFYDRQAFKEAGLDGPPATWQELVADARALKRPGRWGLALTAGSPTGNAQLAYILGRQHGADFFDADGKAQFDTPQLRAAVRTLIELMDTEGAVDPTDAERNGIHDTADALAEGRAAMAPGQSSNRGYFASVGYDDYAVAPLPLPDPMPDGGAPVQSFVAGTNLAVFADTDHRAEALELVGFLTSAKEQVVLNHTFGTLPVVQAAYADPAFSDPVTAAFGRILRDRSETMPMTPAEARMEQVLGGAVRDLWVDAATGEVTDAEIDAALADAERQMAAP